MLMNVIGHYRGQEGTLCPGVAGGVHIPKESGKGLKHSQKERGVGNVDQRQEL